MWCHIGPGFSGLFLPPLKPGLSRALASLSQVFLFRSISSPKFIKTSVRRQQPPLNGQVCSSTGDNISLLSRLISPQAVQQQNHPHPHPRTMSFFAKLGSGSDTDSDSGSESEESILSGEEGEEQDRKLAAKSNKASMFLRSDDEESEEESEEEEEEMSDEDTEDERAVGHALSFLDDGKIFCHEEGMLIGTRPWPTGS
jgi:RNA polymerase-binding transcription factor DksA